MPFVGYTALSTSLSMTFFFSSRRRHTRCLSDWSSDVCSSDLTKREIMAQAAKTFGDSVGQRFLAGHPMAGKEYSGRSEERRVGKECRCRRTSHRYKRIIYILMVLVVVSVE